MRGEECFPSSGLQGSGSTSGMRNAEPFVTLADSYEVMTIGEVHPRKSVKDAL